MIQLLIHAPTPASLERARRNAANLKKADPQAAVEIVANAGAVAAALDDPHPTDEHLLLCQNTLTATGAQAPEHLQTVGAAVLHIAQRQHDGWAYMRA
ncbi:hypothetical protein RAS12_10970 [Achromobacter seleniivolatilans]|uniref:Intracellular sulfur oxidation DsrE/DsrF family protein n=1 Tax=Achromobacter seleniivolatilans TaxID=3047478 RepID=A0ABY9M7B4_9BURK|nr:hypothetical protein [Achromobacter sp. R39]WMD22865.1 hypothetical protein RAS12_10970 [Achromobacter sp. R39]